MVERHGEAVAQAAEGPKEGDMMKLPCNLKKNMEAEAYTSCTTAPQYEHHAVRERLVLVFGTSPASNCHQASRHVSSHFSSLVVLPPYHDV